MFAPNYHSAMKYVGPTRKIIGKRTAFNLLGPLCNPAGVESQLMGIFDGSLTEKIAYVLKKLGSLNAMIVHGDDGLDEISLCSPTYISELKEDKITDYIFDPKDYGYNYININDILGSDAEYNAKTFIEMIDAPNNSFQKIVELNAGAALYVAGLTKNLKDGFNLAKKTIN